jgi:hypothetical protein
MHQAAFTAVRRRKGVGNAGLQPLWQSRLAH